MRAENNWLIFLLCLCPLLSLASSDGQKSINLTKNKDRYRVVDANLQSSFTTLKPYIKLNIGYGVQEFNRIVEDDSLDIGQVNNVQSNAPVFTAELGCKIGDNHIVGFSIQSSSSDFSQSFLHIVPSIIHQPATHHYVENQFKINSLAALGQYYYVFNQLPSIKPYINLSLGVANNHSAEPSMTIPGESVRISADSGDNNSFAYGVGLGAIVPIIDKLSLDINFKYFDYGQSFRAKTMIAEYQNTGKINKEQQEVYTFSSKLSGMMASIGVAYSF